MLLVPLHVQEPASEGDQFAISIAAGGDLNGDCVPDLVIGDATSMDGSDVWFVSGKNGTVLRRLETRYESRCSYSHVDVELIGDVDGDGSQDVAVSFSFPFVRAGF